MTIEEIRQLKAELEKDIEKAIELFETATGMKVYHVTPRDHFGRYISGGAIDPLRVKVQLEGI